MPIRRRDLILGTATLARAASSSIAPLRLKGKEVASFYCGVEWDKPFLYPIRTVSGKTLSRGYPIEKIAGEETDHNWHRGIFYGHGMINGHDFWRELGREKTSRLVVKGIPNTAGASVSAAIDMITPDGKSLGSMRQQFSIEDRGSLRFIDAVIAIQAVHGALTFGDTDDGGFAFRLKDAFRQDRGAKLCNSSGLEGTENIWGKPAHWVDYSAVVDGAPAGVAVFDHPGNLRHPTAWHARGYSLCSANPFAAKSFSKGKAPDGSYTLAAGATLRLRYRVVIHEGPLDPAGVEKLYRAWAG
jgi:hypothetical protein